MDYKYSEPEVDYSSFEIDEFYPVETQPSIESLIDSFSGQY